MHTIIPPPTKPFPDAPSTNRYSRLAATRFGLWSVCLVSLSFLIQAGVYMTHLQAALSCLILGLLIAWLALFCFWKTARFLEMRIFLLLAIATLLGGITISLHDQTEVYNLAVQDMQAGEYEDALYRFERLDGFRDSAEQSAICEQYIQYEEALAMMETSPSYAYALMFRLRGFPPADAALATPEFQLAREAAYAVGGSLSFGSYYQTETATGQPAERKPIRWKIIARDGDRALLLSSRVLDVHDLHSSGEPVTWADCSLRQWLNSDFLSVAFTPGEQALILQTTVDNGDAPATQDYLFLLSYDEVCRYIPQELARRAQETYYLNPYSPDYHAWLLRPVQAESASAPCINPKGMPDVVHSVLCEPGIRPAMWVVLDPDFF